MKAIWSGAIAFGLVNIPVKLYSAITDNRLDFDMLDKKDHSNIRYKRVNESTGREVAWNNIVKGYKIKDKYVVLTKADFDKASPEKTKLIALEAFVKTEEIDVILYNSAYYVYPAKNGERAFALLADTIRKSNRSGIGSFVLRNREHLVVLRVAENVMILHTLRFLEEIRDPADYELKTISKAKSKPGELRMANSLVRSMEEKFDIRKYKDSYNRELMKRIRAKASGKKLPAAKTPERSLSGDLVEQLKKSIASRKK